MKNLNDMTEEAQIKLVKDYPFDIRYIENPSISVQLAAVQQYGDAIKYIENPNDAVQLAAVKKFGSAIYYIKNPSKDTVITAILKLINLQLYYYTIEFINKYDDNNWPELDIIKTSLRADGIIK